MARRLLTRRRKKPNMCEYHPTREAVTGVALHGKVLFYICASCKGDMVKPHANPDHG